MFWLKVYIKKQNKQFEKINTRSKAFTVNYCGNTIIRDLIFGISKENMNVDDVLILMDLFALPYKAVASYAIMMQISLTHFQIKDNI